VSGGVGGINWIGRGTIMMKRTAHGRMYSDKHIPPSILQ